MHGILCVLNRLFSLVVAVAIAAAPVTLDACQIVCASMSAHPMPAPDAHQGHHHRMKAGGSCHEPPSATSHLSPQSPSCAHEVEAIFSSVAGTRSSDSVLLLAAAVPRVDDVVFGRRVTFVQIRQSSLPDRLEAHLARALRI